MHPRIILAIAKKDILDGIKNAYILFALILPLGMSLLFRFIIPGDEPLKVIIYDPGQSQLVEQIRANPAVSLTLASSAAEVPERVRDDMAAGIVLPAGFDAALAAGQTPELEVFYKSQGGSLAMASLRNILEDTLRTLAGQSLPARLALTDVTGSEEADPSPEFDVANFNLVLLLVMGLCMVGVFVVPSMLVEEKEKHTLQAILVSPANYLDLILGKSLVGLFYSLLLGLLLLALNQGLSGHPTVTILAVFLGSLFLVLLGLLMGSLFSTTTQVNTWSSVIMMALLVPPIIDLPNRPPAPLSTIARLIPTSYLADAISLGLSETASPGSAATNLTILAVAALVTAAVAVWALRRERR